ncbi:MAG: TonB-dependent receptor, partial [Acidobacteria bacterium]|nr:TonB-dependent receptor [Acidobacteriota bacterium]
MPEKGGRSSEVVAAEQVCFYFLTFFSRCGYLERAVAPPKLQPPVPDNQPKMGWIAFFTLVQPTPHFNKGFPLFQQRGEPHMRSFAFSSLLWICFAFGPRVGVAQTLMGTVEGIVVDPQTRRLPNATLELVEIGRRAFSDVEGKYQFREVPPGQHTLRAWAAGLREVQVDGLVVRAGQITSQTVSFTLLQPTSTQIDVIGEDISILREIPGSAALVTQEQLLLSRPLDANEVLRRMPGVHIREDSGPVGMRLNIGIRGLNPDRSRQVLVLEDGLPVALAPYGEPELYYSPPIDRMRRIEVLKGSGSILHGPQTIGGVLNFITPDPPARPQGSLDLIAGQRGLLVGKASYGGSLGPVGALLTLLRKQGDGFRDFFFDINDVTAKFHVPLSEKHTVGLKLNFYDEKSNSTYLGLTQSQFEQNPNQNAVPKDRLFIRRYLGSLSYQAVLSARAVLNTTLFAYTTTRNWRRQDFDRARVAGRSYLGVFGDETLPGGAVFLRNSNLSRDRSFEVVGVETRLAREHTILGIRSKFDGGARYLYERAHDQQIQGATRDSVGGVIRDDDYRPAQALSLFFQERFFLGDRVTLTPGLRLEKYGYERNILRAPVGGVPSDVNIHGEDDVFGVIPGFGATFLVADRITTFFGVHRGFAPPRVKDAISNSGASVHLDAELSWNYEVGLRLAPTRSFSAEATFFTLDFENQIIPASQSGGATSSLINAGETIHRGVEFQAGADLGQLLNWKPSLLVEAQYTYLPVARFSNGIFRGNRLPYAPQDSFSLLVGFRRPNWFGIQLDGTLVGTQFADNRQTVAPSSNGEVGLIPSYMLWNLSFDMERSRERYSIQPF